MMDGKFRVIMAIIGLVLAILACQAVILEPGGGEETTTPDAPSPRVIFSDDFSSVQWGTGTDSDSSVENANNVLQMIVYTTNYFVWSTPNDQTYQDVHMETTVLTSGTD